MSDPNAHAHTHSSLRGEFAGGGDCVGRGAEADARGVRALGAGEEGVESRRKQEYRRKEEEMKEGEEAKEEVHFGYEDNCRWKTIQTPPLRPWLGQRPWRRQRLGPGGQGAKAESAVKDTPTAAAEAAEAMAEAVVEARDHWLFILIRLYSIFICYPIFFPSIYIKYQVYSLS